jgi:hypothetical protein
MISVFAVKTKLDSPNDLDIDWLPLRSFMFDRDSSLVIRSQDNKVVAHLIK